MLFPLSYEGMIFSISELSISCLILYDPLILKDDVLVRANEGYSSTPRPHPILIQKADSVTRTNGTPITDVNLGILAHLAAAH